MSAAQAPDPGQAALWNGPAGHAWVEAQQTLDRMLKPFEDLLAEAVPEGTQILDVGCGTGATTLAVAQRLGAKGACVGVDISAPMIAAARARAEAEGASADFICADAQTYAFAPESFDRIISRFGVMFFSDPVAAFANLRRAARPGAELHVVVWRGPADNPFMTTAERAAAPFLPSLPARQPDAPGQFAFADQSRVRRILEAGGWRDIDIRPIDAQCAFAEQDLTLYLARLGPLGVVLNEVDEQTRANIVGKVRRAFDPFVRGDEVAFTAACWAVSAKA